MKQSKPSGSCREVRELDDALEGDPPEESASGEIDLLSPRVWNGFVVHEKCEVASTALPDALRQHRSDFDGGSHWTLICNARGRPIGCESENVRFVTVESRIWAYPSEGTRLQTLGYDPLRVVRCSSGLHEAEAVEVSVPQHPLRRA